MVRLASQNRESPVQLLGYDNAGQFVRKRERSKAPAGRCTANQRCIEAVGPSDHKGQWPGGELPAVELSGKIGTGPPRAYPCERDQGGAGGDARDQPLCLLQPLGRDIWSSARLAHLVLPENGIPLQPFPIVIQGFAVVGPQFPDGDEIDFQWSAKPLTHTSHAAGARLRPARSPACTHRSAC